MLRRSTPFRALIVAVLLPLAGCRDATKPLVVSDLVGTWFPATFSASSPEEQFVMHLRVDDTLVTGNGTWGAAPGLNGTLDVHGVVHDAAVTLDVAYQSADPTFAAIPTRHFVGVLTQPWMLSGTLTVGTTTRAYGFEKPRPID